MNNKRGLTLVEILVTVTILLIIGTVFFRYFIFSQETTVENKEKLQALNIAQEVLENVKQGTCMVEITLPEAVPIEYKEENFTEDCLEIFTNNEFNITITIHPEFDDLGLYPVEVFVIAKNGEDKSHVKGLVEL